MRFYRSILEVILQFMSYPTDQFNTWLFGRTLLIGDNLSCYVKLLLVHIYWIISYEQAWQWASFLLELVIPIVVQWNLNWIKRACSSQFLFEDGSDLIHVEAIQLSKWFFSLFVKVIGRPNWTGLPVLVQSGSGFKRGTGISLPPKAVPANYESINHWLVPFLGLTGSVLVQVASSLGLVMSWCRKLSSL